MAKTNSNFSLLSAKWFLAVGVFLLIFGWIASISLSAQTVNQGYKSDEPLQKGMLVATAADDASKVEKLTKDNIDRLKGVVVDKNDSPVTLADSGNNVFVATSGSYQVLVSTENGEIKKNDYIGISSLAGIGMKASDSLPVIIGRASIDFNGREDSIGSYEDPNTKQKINFGRIPVAVAIERNPLLKDEKGNSIPKLLQRVSVTVAGKQVNTARIWLATAVFLGTAFIVGVMLYSGARSSLISVGRNPLSKSVIVRGLLQIVVLSVIVFITGMFGVYLLLKL